MKEKTGPIFLVPFIHTVLCMVTTPDPSYNSIPTDNIFNLNPNNFLSRHNEEWPENKSPPVLDNDQFDFIVIGAGSGGSALASRLSEVPHWRVLLIEAGRPELNLLTDIPLACITLQRTPFSWPYKMAKQDNACLAMNDQQCIWPKGKVLGGTSVINYLVYTRGNHHDFDKWEKQGNPGWSYDDILPYYLKSERAKLKYADPEYHNENGSLSVEDVPFRTVLADAFLEAGVQTGRRLVDCNSRDNFGFSYVQATMRNGRRCSAAKAFLYEAGNRPNLRILPVSRATKILINPETKQAYGIQYIRNRKIYTAYASKEVILSTGPFASPQLLMLSGIGPRDHLQSLNIAVMQDLPVGQCLQDHLTFPGVTFMLNQSVGFDFASLANPRRIFDYFARSNGALTSSGGAEAIAYIKTPVSNELGDNPDIELILTASALNLDGGLMSKDTLNMRQDYYDEAYNEINFKPSFLIAPMLLHPKSKGYLRLKSTNIFHPPMLHGKYFTDPTEEDLRTMVAAIREIQILASTEPFQKYGTSLYRKPLPGCQHHQFDSDSYWKCALQQVSFSLGHQVCTCRMGPENDPEAVVDNKLRVYGIKNLRVADSSVIPFPLAAHTNAPSIMIGERAADFIKDDWLENEYNNRLRF